ncbi:MAG: hypothetical protein IH797_03700 [Chloroflexi bacterium]|nr:hypothetical protein [Chloroflexota bacterium]
MEPRIQYAQTKDGVSIAYCVMGEGRPLVHASAWPFCHLEAEWWVPTYRLWHERLAEKTRLVRYDPRGSGLSQRDVDDLSLDARLLDGSRVNAIIRPLSLTGPAVSIRRLMAKVMAPGVEPRIKAIAPMCPSGGETPVYPRGKNYARDALDFAWGPDVATLFMVADRDSWLPLYGQLELFGRVPGAKRMVILRRADHQHFIDSGLPRTGNGPLDQGFFVHSRYDHGNAHAGLRPTLFG